MTVHQRRFISTTATALVLGAALAAPATARPDAGPAVEQELTSTSCPLTRVGTQLVRCDDLTGNGVSAPLWIPQH
jgi:hypothetical protein